MPEKVYQFGVGSAAKIQVRWINEPLVLDQFGDQKLERGPLQTPIREIDVGSGFPVGMDKPIVVFERTGGKFPSTVVEPLGYRDTFIFSDDFKEFVEAVDPGAFECVEAESRIVTKNGERHGPRYWACDLTRFVDALDVEASKARVTDYPGHYKLVGPSGAHKAHFRRSQLAGRHIFRIPLDPDFKVCDEVFRNAALDAGFKKHVGLFPMGVIDDD